MQDNFMMNNYKSNEIIDKNSIFSNLAAESQDDDFGKQVEKDLNNIKDLCSLDEDNLGSLDNLNLDLDDYNQNMKANMFEINDTDDLERLEEEEDNIAEQLKNFGNANFEEDIRKALSQAIEEEHKST